MSTLSLVPVACSIAIIATLMVARLTLAPTMHALRSRSWVPLNATLLFIERIGSEYGFTVDLRYGYTGPDGVERTGNRFLLNSHQQSNLKQFRAVFPEPPTTGSQVRVFVNPEDYQDSVVVPGLTQEHVLTLLALSTCLLSAATFLVIAL